MAATCWHREDRAFNVTWQFFKNVQCTLSPTYLKRSGWQESFKAGSYLTVRRVGEVYFSDYPPNYWRRRQEHLRSTVEKEGPSDQCFGFWVTSRREYSYTWNCQECISLFLHGTNAVQKGHIHDAGQSRDEGDIIIMHKAGGEVDYFPQNMEYTGEGAWTFGYCWSWA